MSRIQERFELLKKKKQKALTVFITAGDPDLASTREIFSVLESNGADIVELGVPFSDPIADGPVIQKSALRSLGSGTTLKKIIQLVAEIRQTSQLPIVLMTSYNPVYVYGQEKFVDDAVRVGVDGVIVPDLPPEESLALENYAHQKGLDVIYLLAPTSTEDRVKVVSQRTKGFIYYISLTGITGTRDSLATGLKQRVDAIKKHTHTPVQIGFGISDAEQAGQAAKLSDGVIVGSAIVRVIEGCNNADERKLRVGNFVKELKQAIIDQG